MAAAGLWPSGAAGAFAASPDHNDEISAPLVFLCVGCRSVLGDTWAFVSSDAATKSVTLRGVSGIIKEQAPVFSTQGFDACSTYQHLKCRRCKATIGRTYISTPRHLDAMRDMFVFDTDAICSYELGRCELLSEVDDPPDDSTPRKMPPPRPCAPAQLATLERKPGDAGGGSSGDGGSRDCSGDDGAAASDETTDPADAAGEGGANRYGAVWAEIDKIEGVVLQLHERVAHLEELNSVKLAPAVSLGGEGGAAAAPPAATTPAAAAAAVVAAAAAAGTAGAAGDAAARDSAASSGDRPAVAAAAAGYVDGFSTVQADNSGTMGSPLPPGLHSPQNGSGPTAENGVAHASGKGKKRRVAAIH